jgi:mRNA interferase MazF
MKTREPVDPRRGDILWIDCDPSVGAEPKKIRSCVVVQNDDASQFGATVTVIPTLAFSAERASRPYNVDLRPPRSTMEKPRVANASTIMTYDRRRIVGRAGRVTIDALGKIDRALAVHLGLADP